MSSFFFPLFFISGMSCQSGTLALCASDEKVQLIKASMKDDGQYFHLHSIEIKQPSNGYVLHNNPWTCLDFVVTAIHDNIAQSLRKTWRILEFHNIYFLEYLTDIQYEWKPLQISIPLLIELKLRCVCVCVCVANGLGDQSSIPSQVIPKTQKMALDPTLFNTQHYKALIKGKMEQSRESSALSYTSK